MGQNAKIKGDASVAGGTPVGSTIVAADILAFGIFSLASRISGGVAK